MGTLHEMYVYLYLAELFLESEIFQTKDVEKTETHFYVQHIFFYENHAVRDNAEK